MLPNTWPVSVDETLEEREREREREKRVRG
jgi:hypothetical protein